MTEEKNTKPYGEIKLGREKDAMLEFTGSITPETLEQHRKLVIQRIRKEFEAPGFRKGHAPEHLVLKGTSSSRLLEEAADSALREVYPLIVDDLHLKVVTPPDLTVTKLAFGNPLEFTVRVGLYPEVTLPDYKGIAKKIMREDSNPIEVTEAQVEALVKEVRELRAHSGETAPELTDEFVKTLGSFESVDDFKRKMAENLMLEKELERRKKKREAIARELVAASKLSIPSALVENELVAARDALYNEINELKLLKEEYFKRIGKTEEEFLNAQREALIRQFKTKFILEAIAEEEGIEPTNEELEAEVAAVSTRYPGIEPGALLRYVTEMLRNEKALQFLEAQGDKSR